MPRNASNGFLVRARPSREIIDRVYFMQNERIPLLYLFLWLYHQLSFMTRFILIFFRIATVISLVKEVNMTGVREIGGNLRTYIFILIGGMGYIIMHLKQIINTHGNYNYKSYPSTCQIFKTIFLKWATIPQAMPMICTLICMLWVHLAARK